MSAAQKTSDTDTGLNVRLVMTMASEMATAKRNMERACIIFQALATSVGVNVAHEFLLK